MVTTSRVCTAIAACAYAGLCSAARAQHAAADADSLRAIVAESIADAQSRTSLLADGAHAGHDGRFYIAAPDADFRLNFGGLIQTRYFAEFRDDSDSSAGLPANDEFEPGFTAWRTRLNFTGHILNPAWTYRIESQFDRADGTFDLLDAFVAHDLGDGWSVQWGQFKIAYAHEQNLSPAKYLTVDQSVVNAVFGQTYSQGVQLKHQAETWRVFAGFTDGLRSLNTDLTNPAESDFALHARAELAFIAAPWARFEDFTSQRGADLAGMIGAAVYYSQSANTANPGDVDTDYLGFTADISVKGDAWNLFVAGHGRHLEFCGPASTPGNADSESDDFGALVQGGFRFTDTTELFARWDAVFLDDDSLGSDVSSSVNFLTFGINHYIAGHAAKLTADVVWALDDTQGLINSGIGGFPNSGIGLLGSPQDNEVVLRLQFQLIF